MKEDPNDLPWGLLLFVGILGFFLILGLVRRLRRGIGEMIRPSYPDRLADRLAVPAGPQDLPPLMAPAPSPDDAFADFEQHLRASFDTGLLMAGCGFIRGWLILRRAIKDLFLSMDGPDEARVRALGHELGRTYGLFVWATARTSPDDKGHLDRFLEAFAPRPWEGLLEAEPRHALDCYHALPHLAEQGEGSGHAFLVVTKTGILLAQEARDPIAEGLLWGVLADMMLDHYAAFGLDARNALDRLLHCGTQVFLSFPGGFDVFEGPLGKVDCLLATLPGEARAELRDFMGKLEETYGTAFRERYGRGLRSRALES